MDDTMAYMGRSSIVKKLLIFLITTAAVLMVIGFLANSLTKVGFFVGLAIVSALFTSFYFVVITFVAWLRRKYGMKEEQKLKYVLSGALIANLMPISIVLPPFWVLLDLYSLPAELVGKTLGQANLFVSRPDGIFLLPDMQSLIIVIPFWTIIGGVIGYFLFRLRQTKHSSKPL